MPRKAWDVGNLFAVPLADGSYAIAQVVGREAEVLNSITCAFFRTRLMPAALDSLLGVPDQKDLIAVQFVAKDQLTRRVWKVLGNYPITVPQHLYPHEDKRGSALGWPTPPRSGTGVFAAFHFTWAAGWH